MGTCPASRARHLHTVTILFLGSHWASERQMRNFKKWYKRGFSMSVCVRASVCSLLWRHFISFYLIVLSLCMKWVWKCHTYSKSPAVLPAVPERLHLRLVHYWQEQSCHPMLCQLTHTDRAWNSGCRCETVHPRPQHSFPGLLHWCTCFFGTFLELLFQCVCLGAKNASVSTTPVFLGTLPSHGLPHCSTRAHYNVLFALDRSFSILKRLPFSAGLVYWI